MPYATARDGTRIYYKDWGQGRPVVLIHGWPLSSDTFDDAALALAEKGYRAIAHDRRGFGRSDQPWGGYDYDTFSDDVAAVLDAGGTLIAMGNAVRFPTDLGLARTVDASASTSAQFYAPRPLRALPPDGAAKTVTENCEEKCDHIPSRVPGLPHTVRTAPRDVRTLLAHDLVDDAFAAAGGDRGRRRARGRFETGALGRRPQGPDWGPLCGRNHSPGNPRLCSPGNAPKDGG